MHLMYTIDDAGNRVFTLKVCGALSLKFLKNNDESFLALENYGLGQDDQVRTPRSACPLNAAHIQLDSKQ